MNKKQLALSIALLTTSGMASAEGTKVGLGVSVKSDDTKIYLPIDVSQSIRIEPSIEYIKVDSNGDYDLIEFSVGVFGLAPVSSDIGIYYGARIGYLDFDSDGAGDVDGYSFSPTIGLEYWVNERFSIAAEAEWSYVNLDGDNGFSDTKSNSTDTNLLVRYFF